MKKECFMLENFPDFLDKIFCTEELKKKKKKRLGNQGPRLGFV